MTEKIVKLAHFGDVHIGSEKGDEKAIRRFIGKRFLGTVNLRLLGRGQQFHDARNRFPLLLQDIKRMSPDLIISSGDFSAVAFTSELQIASNCIHRELEGFEDRICVVPGNHDRYTLGAVFSKRFEKYFGLFMQSDDYQSGENRFLPYSRIIGDTFLFLFLDVSRFHFLSRGKVKKSDINWLKKVLREARNRELKVFIVVHYPPERADGSDLTFTHRCLHIERLVELAQQFEVKAFFTGHVHKNYINKLKDTNIYLVNAGSATHTHWSTYNQYVLNDSSLTVLRKEFRAESKRYEVFDEKVITL